MGISPQLGRIIGLSYAAGLISFSPVWGPLCPALQDIFIEVKGTERSLSNAIIKEET
jgi:hypothetical protein